MTSRDQAGVGLAFVGFVVLVAGFKGTWKKVFKDLWSGADSGAYNPNDPAGTGYTGPVIPNATTTPGTVVPGSDGGPDYLVPADPNGKTIPLTPTAGLRLPNTRLLTPTGLLT